MAWWTCRLQTFFNDTITPAKSEFKRSADVEIIADLVDELSKEKHPLSIGNNGHLGVVTATKFLFFACPEMPVFIYDSYVGKALKTPTLASKHYHSQWWEKCSGLQRMNPSALSLLRPEHRDEFADKEDWFTRRALDLMLYRIGHKLAEESKA